MKQIPNSKYYVDTQGKVYNPRKRELSLCYSKKGYLRVKVNIYGKLKTMPVHRLVAIAYIPNPEDKPQVNHINGVKDDNRVENLEWVTPQENSRHAVDVLGVGVGETHSRVIYSTETIHTICRMLEEGRRNCDIARHVGVEKHVVSQIRRRQRWNSISKDYNFTKTKQNTLSEETVRWICRMFENGLLSCEIRDTYSGSGKLSDGTLSKIKNRQSFTEISKDYDF